MPLTYRSPLPDSVPAYSSYDPMPVIQTAAAVFHARVRRIPAREILDTRDNARVAHRANLREKCDMIMFPAFSL